jgi:hypothetical protein
MYIKSDEMVDKKGNVKPAKGVAAKQETDGEDGSGRISPTRRKRLQQWSTSTFLSSKSGKIKPDGTEVRVY